MHRRPLLKMLEEYGATYPDEVAVAARIAGLVEAHPDCFERTCRPGHLTGSAWVLSHDRQKCLLVHHRKLDRWLQPGGHADGQCEIEAVALREAMEESGLESLRLAQACPLDLDVHRIPARRSDDGALIEDAHEHHDVRFLVVTDRDEQPRVSDESHDVRWFTRDEVLQRTNEESVLRLLRKAGPNQG